MKRKIINKPLRKFAEIEDTAQIRVVFPFSPQYLAEIKQIQDRTWNKNKKCWYIPLNLKNCFTLRNLKYVLGKELKAWVNKEHKGRNLLVQMDNIPGLGGILRPFQSEGVSFIEKNNGRALIADEMGLGKTVQTLAWLQLHPEARPAIIICPATLKLNWQNETRKWLSASNTQVIFGTQPEKIPLIGDIIIINYHIIPNKFETLDSIDRRTGKSKKKELYHTGWIDYLIDFAPKVLIVDESHKIKNNSAGWTKPILKLSKQVQYSIALSGTPIEKETADIYNSIQLINPNLFANRWSFLHKYCAPKNNGFGWQFKGATNTKELFNLLQNVMIRRKKKNVLTELPDKIHSFIPLKIDNKKEYQEAAQNFKQYVQDKTEVEIRQLYQNILKEENSVIEINAHKLNKLKKEKADKATALSQIEELKQLAVKGKLAEVIKWISDFLENGEKLIVFCEHLFPMDAIENKFKKICVRIDGGVSHGKRQKAVDDFQNNNKIRLFIGNSAAQEGITLTAASNVAIIEYPWNPGPLAQRIDRAHRIGQKDIVNAYFLIAISTIEEKIAKGLLEKQKISDKVLDGELTETSSLLEDIVNSFKYKI